jgi:hypothetical protein
MVASGAIESSAVDIRNRQPELIKARTTRFRRTITPSGFTFTTPGALPLYPKTEFDYPVCWAIEEIGNARWVERRRTEDPLLAPTNYSAALGEYRPKNPKSSAPRKAGLATVTSLPELVTGITSVAAAKARNIATGDALGSCVLNLSGSNSRRLATRGCSV